MATLHDLARLIRSKNAGPFAQTLDVMFENEKDYLYVRDHDIITPAKISALYGIPEDKIKIFTYDTAYAIKVTYPRPIVAGDVGNTDVYGAQQHAPLLTIEV